MQLFVSLAIRHTTMYPEVAAYVPIKFSNVDVRYVMVILFVFVRTDPCHESGTRTSKLPRERTPHGRGSEKIRNGWTRVFWVGASSE